MIVTTTKNPIIYETTSNAHGEKLKKGLGKIGKVANKVGHAISKAFTKAEQFVVKKSKVVAKDVKKVGGKIKAKAKTLVHHKDKSGKDVFKNVAPILTADQASKLQNVVDVGGNLVDGTNLDPTKPIVFSTDPTTGQQTVGNDYTADEVVATDGADGNVEYAKPNDVQGEEWYKNKFVIGGGILLLGTIIYFVTRKKKLA